MASINRVTLIGNLGRDPERQTTSNGTPYAKFSVATNESYQDRNGTWQKSTEWHNVKVWGASVDRVLQQLRKGSLVYIEGSLRSFEMNDQQMSSGPKVKLWEIKAITWRSLDPRENQGGDFSQGNAGNSGFGGGGGAGGRGGLLGAAGVPGSGGFAGADGSDLCGGSGAGLGGAIFLKSGRLRLDSCRFQLNRAIGGLGARSGQGKGGAIFVLSRYSDGKSIEFRSEIESSDCAWVDNFASSATGRQFDNHHICLEKVVPI